MIIGTVRFTIVLAGPVTLTLNCLRCRPLFARLTNHMITGKESSRDKCLSRTRDHKTPMNE